MAHIKCTVFAILLCVAAIAAIDELPDHRGPIRDSDEFNNNAELTTPSITSSTTPSTTSSTTPSTTSSTTPSTTSSTTPSTTSSTTHSLSINDTDTSSPDTDGSVSPSIGSSSAVTAAVSTTPSTHTPSVIHSSTDSAPTRTPVSSTETFGDISNTTMANESTTTNGTELDNGSNPKNKPAPEGISSTVFIIIGVCALAAVAVIAGFFVHKSRRDRQQAHRLLA